MVKRRTDYSTGSEDGMSFICNRWTFTGPQGYRVKPNDDGTFRVVSYNAVEDWQVIGSNTSMSEDDAHALAASMASTTPHPKPAPEVHVISATAIVVGDVNHSLAMCGADMGPYENIPRCHPVGNYLWSGSPLWETVTCAGCLTRCGRV